MSATKSLEEKVDTILNLLQPQKSSDPAVRTSMPDLGMSVYVREINELRKKLKQTEANLDMARQLLLRKQMQAPSPSPMGGTGPRITRRGSVELRQMSNNSGQCPEPAKKMKKALFRLLKANDKEVFFLCPDYQIKETPQSTNLVRLVWEESPKTILLIKKPGDDEITKFAFDMAKWLNDEMKVNVLVEPVVMKNEGSKLDFLATYEEEESSKLHEIVDFVVCLGGDGTLLWLSNLFRTSVPPVISFAMGSLGFLTPFPAQSYKHYLTQAIKGGFYLTLRSRLQVSIERASEKTGKSQVPKNLGKRTMSRRWNSTTEIYGLRNYVGNLDPIQEAKDTKSEPQKPQKPKSRVARLVQGISKIVKGSPAENSKPQRVTRAESHSALGAGSDFWESCKDESDIDWKKQPSGTVFLALNEVIVDNAKSTSLTNLDCYCDGVFTTKCQGDGLIVATPTGSTAYSLSAGGSMVHPQVPGMLFTPVCPHSLSFRPIVFPDTSKISIRVSADARSNHSVAFDGRSRQTLYLGDTVHVENSSWPVPAICRVSETEDWFTGVQSLLHWNLRTSQKKMQRILESDDSETRNTG